VDYRDRALKFVEDGIVDSTRMLIACLLYMSQDEVKDMLNANELEIEEDDTN